MFLLDSSPFLHDQVLVFTFLYLTQVFTPQKTKLEVFSFTFVPYFRNSLVSGNSEEKFVRQSSGVVSSEIPTKEVSV